MPIYIPPTVSFRAIIKLVTSISPYKALCTYMYDSQFQQNLFKNGLLKNPIFRPIYQIDNTVADVYTFYSALQIYY